MGIPNGEMDPWADTIVAGRFRYVQVSAFYDQLTDVTGGPTRVSHLPGGRRAASTTDVKLDPARLVRRLGVQAAVEMVTV